MILSDTEIASEVHYGDLDITPFDESNIQPASLDIRLGNEFRRFCSNEPVDPLNDSVVSRGETIEDGEKITLEPSEFVLATTKETVDLPADLCANVDGRSSYGRMGVSIHITAGFIDPGFCGEITLELKNENRMPLELTPGARVGQLVFKRLSEPCKVPYGEERGSQYQGQRGAQPARLHRGVGDE